MEIFPKPVAITVRFEFFFHLAERDVARPKCLDDVPNDKSGFKSRRQISGNGQRAIRAIGEVGGVQDDLGREQASISRRCAFRDVSSLSLTYNHI